MIIPARNDKHVNEVKGININTDTKIFTDN